MALAAAVGMTAAACADSESMIFIRQVQARVSTGATACVADSSPTSLALDEGFLDVAFRTRYTASLLVGNQLVPRGDNTSLRTETSRVEIQGTIVRAIDDSGAVVWGPVTVPGTGFVEPASGSTPSFGLTETTLFQADDKMITDLQMNPGVRHDVAIAKVFGRTLGGTDVESGEWQFPINICFKCLVTFPSDANSGTAQNPNCDQTATQTTAVDAPCNPGQDDNLDCRACKEIFSSNANCEPTP
ncbi:MAG TPA: hypothetical protein VGL13_05580 [Polyangiaceae bacterium]